MSKSKTVLVAGATGNQGGAVAKALLDRGDHVRALTRSPDGPTAKRLRKAGADIITADLEQPASLRGPVEGIDAVFVVSTPFETGVEAEVRQASNLIDAAVAADVAHVVYSSVASADRGTGVPHFESKWAVEEHLRSTGAPSTIIAPTAFMEMLVSPWSLPGLAAGGQVGSPIPAHVSTQRIAMADIGAFAALVIGDSDHFVGQRIELAGDESTGTALAACLSRHVGRDVAYVETPINQAGSEDLELMFRYLAEVGYAVDVMALHASYPEIGWHDLESWAKAQDWKLLLDGGKIGARS